MGVLSDLSGTVMVKGFETYLTAYPLPKSEVYVFARTWYAAEMERPGSVWTHSLLLRSADVAQVEHPSILLPIFRRPPKAEFDLQTYEEPLTLTLGDSSRSADDRQYDPEVVAGILGSLYGQDGPVYLVSSDAEHFEPLLLDLWAQQWPRLRRTFTFCSGALEPRSLRRRSLDLQVVPRPRARSEGVTIGLDGVGTLANDEDWPALVIKDLHARERTPLRSFLRRFGVGVAEMRQGFGALAATFDLIDSDASLLELVTHIGSSFPNPSDAAKLKEVLFTATRMPSLVADEHVVTVLAETPYATSFSDEQTGLPLRLRRLAAEAPDRLLGVLMGLQSRPRSAAAQRVVEMGVAALGPAYLVDLVRAEPLWLGEVLPLQPTIVAHEGFWSLPSYIRADALGIAASTWGRDADLWKSVAGTLTHCDAEAVEQVLRYTGSVMVHALLDTLETESSNENLPLWWVTLDERSAELVSWLAEHPNPGRRSRTVLAHALDPDAEEVRELGVRPWSKVGEEADALRAREDDHRQLAFVLALSLWSTDSEAERLARLIFPHVHSLTAGNQLAERSWKLLGRHRPLHGDPPSWDRCEWLRRRLVDAATSFGWSANTVASALPEHSARAQAVAYAERFPEGRGLAAALRATLPPPPSAPRRTPETKSRPTRSPEKKPAKKPKKGSKPKRRFGLF
jgi:hypothetical protein